MKQVEFIEKLVSELARFQGLVKRNYEILKGESMDIEIEKRQAEQRAAQQAKEDAAREQYKSEKLAKDHAEALEMNAAWIPSAAPAPVAPQSIEETVIGLPAGDDLFSAPVATLKLGQINEKLGFTMTADFLLSLGFAPHAVERASKLYKVSDLPSICAALVRHINKVAEDA